MSNPARRPQACPGRAKAQDEAARARETAFALRDFPTVLGRRPGRGPGLVDPGSDAIARALSDPGAPKMLPPMTRTLRCLLGRHQWRAVTMAGGYDADCWICGRHRRVKARVVHRDVKAQYDAARARDEAFA